MSLRWRIGFVSGGNVSVSLNKLIEADVALEA
jgi:hypothetical protein